MYFVLLSSITEQAHLLFLLSNNDSVSRDNNEEGLSWILYFASTPTKKKQKNVSANKESTTLELFRKRE